MGVVDAVAAFTAVFGLAALHCHLSSVGAEELNSAGAEASAHVGATTTAATQPPRRELAARAAETRRDRRTPRSQVHAQLCARQREAGQRLAAVSTCTWCVLSFIFQLRRRASCRTTALLRVTLRHHPLCAAFVAKLRVLAARRRTALQLLCRSPRPVPYDVGYDDSTGIFSFRDRYGTISRRHPAFAATTGVTPAYSANGSVVLPMSPPPDSPVVLCPEQSGAWCYLNTETMEAQWHPPDGSTPLVSRRFPAARQSRHVPCSMSFSAAHDAWGCQGEMVILPLVLVSSCLVSSVFVALALTVHASSPGGFIWIEVNTTHRPLDTCVVYVSAQPRVGIPSGGGHGLRHRPGDGEQLQAVRQGQ